MKRRFRASYKIAIGFVVFALLAVYGHRYANDILLAGHFPPLAPGSVNILGVDTRAGYHILVENQVAKLVYGGAGSFQAGPMDERSLDTEGSDKKFIPIKDMLLGLQGNVPGMSYFIERLNNITDQENSPNAPVWRIEDIEKAYSGDKVLADKLVHDLSINLDGSPLERVKVRTLQSAVYSGILVEVPVAIEIQTGPEPARMEARVKKTFKAAMLKDIEGKLAGKWNVADLIKSQYAAAVEQIQSGKAEKEDIHAHLRSFAGNARSLADFPQQILNSITTVINENQITGASCQSVAGPRGTTYTLVIRLSDEGKRRLWQFSRDRVGDELLITVNGVAIAAPMIDHGLAGGEIEVSGLQDESLAKSLIDTIDEKRTAKRK